MNKYNVYNESLVIDCDCKKPAAKAKPAAASNCCGGESLPSYDGDTEILLMQIKREIKELMNTTEARLLCQNKKIDETMVYIKNNLSNAIRQLLDSMQYSGELDDIITGTILNEFDLINNTIENLEDDVKEFSETYADLSKKVSVNSGRIDSFTKLAEGSTTADAELTDIRIDYTGETWPNAGDAVRGADEKLQSQITEATKYNDVKERITWQPNRAINSNADIYTPTSATYQIGKLTLPKGAVVSGIISKASDTVSVVSKGTEAGPLSELVMGAGTSANTAFNYTVTAPYEVLWFCCDSRYLADSRINVQLPATYDDPDGFILPNFSKGYINPDGSVSSNSTYAYSDLIEVEAMQQLTFNAIAAASIVTLVEYSSQGAFKRVINRGYGSVKAYEFMTDSTTYVRICTRVRGDLNINELDIKVTPYTQTERRPEFDYRDGYISSSENTSRPGDGTNPYLYTGLIELMEGETIRFYTAGSTGIWALSEWTYDNEFVQGIIQGDDYYHIYEYTADHHMYIRLCGKIETSGDPVVSREHFLNPVCYYKSLYYADVQDSVLYQKKITFIGDSLAYGNRLGPGACWLNLLKLAYDMDAINLGVNGNTVAEQETETTNAPMCERYTEIPESDYIVLIGGANDKRLNVPLGTTVSDDNTTFAGALNTIIDGIRGMYPKAKLLFMTNYNRYPDNNSLGLSDDDYADMMMDVCDNKCVPCFDNYSKSGIYFLDENMSWQDEGMELRGVENRHLSVEAYEWIYNKYKSLLLES